MTLLTAGLVSALATFAAMDSNAPPLRAPVNPVAANADFPSEERARHAAVDDAESPALREAATAALAAFYAAHGLCVEAVDAMSHSAATASRADLLVARCNYMVGRYTRVFDALSEENIRLDDDADALFAMAAARVGAFDVAQRAFDRALAAGGPGADLRAEFQLLKAETEFEHGDSQAAAESLRAAGPLVSDPLLIDEAALLRARAALADGDKRAGREQLSALAASDRGKTAALAALYLAVDEAPATRAEKLQALARLKAVSVRWSGGDFERRALQLIGARANGVEPQAAFAALRRLVDRFPRSDAARQAKAALGDMLIALFADADMAPHEAARLFYENIEFAPQGAAGDALIRNVAERLAALDLLAEAAELLEHQVFNRLRGEERAVVAADLAALYLEDKRPNEALRVIRTTRIAGLAESNVEQRRLIEASALDAINSPAGALALLSDAKDPATLRLRAEIAWREERWSEAGAAYRNLVEAAAGPLNAAARTAAVRAATAFLLAGDDDAFRAFVDKAGPRLGNAPERAVLDALNRDGLLNGDFFDAYRAAFGATAKG